MAFLRLKTAKPAPADWQTASWEFTATSTNNRYFCGCLVGPGGTIALAPGAYWVWVRVTDNPEAPEIQTDTLTIY